LDPQLFLKLADMRAERRLGDAERRGGLGEAAALDDAHKIAKLPNVHRASSSPAAARHLCQGDSGIYAEAIGKRYGPERNFLFLLPAAIGQHSGIASSEGMTMKSSIAATDKPDSRSVIERLDDVVDAFARRTRFFHEDITPGRARMFCLQHRLNTRQRNSVLKLRVATNCSDWETRLRIIRACSEEVIADHEHGGGRAHWQVLEELGRRIGLSTEEMETARPLDSTRMAWLAWEALMSNRPWLEGIVANTCAERVNVPGYGGGLIGERGWFGMERARWKQCFGLSDEELEFFELHEEADIEHSNMGWQSVARYAVEYHAEDAAVEACRVNLMVWEHYLNGIGTAGRALDAMV
jgi:pyrroloquinoline quinone (PQQ) biosynthesis protein C